MNQLKKYTIIFLLFTVNPLSVSAQSESEDLNSSSSNEALAHAMNLYNNVIGRNSMIFTGRYYLESNRGIKGDPFFINNSWEVGTIIYKGQQYDSIEIKYDIFRDLLLVKYVDTRGYITPIQLHNAKVNEFIVMGHHFLPIEEDTLSDFKTGYYDVYHDGGKAKVLIKRRKEINRTQNLGTLEKEYVLNDKWYVKSGDTYYLANSKRSLLEALSDKKNEVKVFLKKNKARFRNDRERQLIEVVQYYNSIVNNTGP